MPKIALEIKSCQDCPFLKTGNEYSTDGFDRMEDWFCTKKSNKKIAGSVEWHDKIPVPTWCPLQIDEKAKKKSDDDVIDFNLNQ